MKTLGEVFDSQFGIKLSQQISQGELTQLNINKQARLITLAVKFNGLVERNTLFDTEKLITKTYTRNYRFHSLYCLPEY